MKMKLGLLLSAALLSFSASAFAAPDPNFYIFLCFGQSNMESGGRMEEMDRTVDKRFQVMADFNAPNRGWKRGNWYDAVPPLAAKGSGICMVDYFGRTMVANTPQNIRVGVIKVSVPGCKIELFEKDTFKTYAATAASWMQNLIKQYDGNPYQYLVDMGKLAQKDGVIKGFLLHQGESNPNDNEWPKKVKGIYDNLIKDLNLKAEETPFLAGETVNADQGGACAGFNKIMAKLPETLPNSYVISSAGCVCNSDHMHFSSAGSREFGKRYGEKMLSIMGYKVAEPNNDYQPNDPAELSFELKGFYSKSWVGEDGIPKTVGGKVQELICEGKTIELASNEFDGEFLETKQYGKIKIQFSSSLTSSGFSVWLTPKQKEALIKAFKSASK